MAIDTATKRRSISGIGWILPGVTPDVTEPQEWRQSSGWSYSGILAGAPVVGGSGGTSVRPEWVRAHVRQPVIERVPTQKEIDRERKRDAKRRAREGMEDADRRRAEIDADDEEILMLVVLAESVE